MRAALVALGLLLAGCGDRNGPPQGPDEAAIRRLFTKLDRVQAAGDARTACEEVFTVQEPAERARGRGGEGEAEGEAEESPEACRQAFERSLASSRQQVRELRTEVQRVEVRGDEAFVRVRARVVRTDGSAFENVYARELVRGGEGWRIRISPEG